MSAQNKKSTQEYVYDFAAQGGAIGALTLPGLNLPKGSIVTNVIGVVEAAVTSAGAPTLALGNTTTAAKYIAAQALAAMDTIGKVIGGAPAVQTPQNLVANDLPVVATIATATITAGKIRFMIEFYLPSSQAITGF